MAAPPPTGAQLDGLDVDAWAQVIRAARVAIRGLPDLAVTPQSSRLRDLPVSRLAGGRGRRDLTHLLSEGGAVWIGVHAELTAHGPDVLGALTAGPPLTAARDTAGSDAEILGLRETVAGVRARLREVTSDRDELRRKLDGAEARAAAAAAATTRVTQELSSVTQRLDEMESARSDAAVRVAEAVAREQRRGTAERARLEADATAARRDLDRARKDLAEAQRASAAPAAVSPTEPIRPTGLQPGRPSKLPDGVERPSLEAAELLVTPGRVVLVDGWNVAQFHRPNLDREEQRRWLVDGLVAATGRWRAQFTVVFDSHSLGESPGTRERRSGVIIAYPPPHVSADDELVFAIAAMAPGVPVTVVTDDRELQGRLLEHGADILSSMEFGWLLAS